MSIDLFGRVATLDIGVPGEQGKRIRSFYIDESTRVVTDGLRITFSIEKTSESTPNKASIEVYNLAPDTIALLKKKKCRVTLSAGYGLIRNQNASSAELLFKGDTAKSYTKKSGQDLITTIEVGDGLTAFQSTKINESFSEGVTGTTIVDRVTSAMGLSKGEISGLSGINFSGGFVASGNARDTLDDVAEKGDLEWSIQDDAIQMLPINGFTKLEAIKLTSDTGLIGSPNKTGFNNSSNKKGKSDGVEFVSLLQPGLVPGRRVQILSKFVEGVFVVRKTKFHGDTKSGPWFSECEALPV